LSVIQTIEIYVFYVTFVLDQFKKKIWEKIFQTYNELRDKTVVLSVVCVLAESDSDHLLSVEW